MAIVFYPNRDLSKRAVDADPFDINLYRDLRLMKSVMESMKGVGIAAPQVGINKRIAIIAPPESGFYVLINPELLWSSDEIVEGVEGCLSVPNLDAKIKRPYSVQIRYTTLAGVETMKTFEGFEARIVQHEIDHLDGILIVDRMSKVKRMLYKHRRVR